MACDLSPSLRAAADALGCIATDDDDQRVIADLRTAADRLAALTAENERLRSELAAARLHVPRASILQTIKSRGRDEAPQSGMYRALSTPDEGAE